MAVNLILWSVALLGAMVIVATDLRRKVGVQRGGVHPSLAILAVDALLIIGVGLGSSYGLEFPKQSPRIYQALQGILPLMLCLAGGWFSAHWFVARRPARDDLTLHSLPGAIALGLALGMVLLTEGLPGIVLDSGAVITLVLVWLLAQQLGERGLRSVRLGAALGLLWAGAFLVYLMIFPAEVVVEATAEEGAGTAAAAVPGESLLWVAPLVFLAAFLLGFFKRQRG